MALPTHSAIHVDDRGEVRWIILDAPKSRNGLTLKMVDVLADIFEQTGEETSVRTVVLTGANGAFCSGLDLKDALKNAGNPEDGVRRFQRLARSVWNLMKPTIAAIDGPASGFGADLALGCDMRVASENARIGEGFVRIGLMPDGGGTFHLPRLVGLGHAFEMIYSGRLLEADEALRIGLVNRILPAEGFQDAVHEWASTFAAGPPLAFAYAKASIHAGLGDPEVCFEAEREGQVKLTRSADFSAGVQAFFTKSKPKFTGK